MVSLKKLFGKKKKIEIIPQDKPPSYEDAYVELILEKCRRVASDFPPRIIEIENKDLRPFPSKNWVKV